MTCQAVDSAALAGWEDKQPISHMDSSILNFQT